MVSFKNEHILKYKYYLLSRLGMVVHVRNLNYVGDRGSRIVVWGQPVKKS
jgi:hypothetical protein